MDAYSLALMGPIHIASKKQYNLKYIYGQVVPLRKFPFYAHGIGAPDFRNLATPITEELVDLWRFSVGDTLFVWLRIFQSFWENRNYDVRLEKSWDIFHKIFNEVIPPTVDRASLLIPWVETHSTPGGMRAYSRMITITDYIGLTNRSPGQFVLDILQTILFGFVVDKAVVQALQLENSILSYVTSCLRQGMVDHMLNVMSGSKASTSVFDRVYRTSRTQDLYTKIGKMINHHIQRNGSSFQSSGTWPGFSKDLEQSVNKMPHLGVHTDTFKELGRMGMFTPEYQAYLKRYLPTGMQYYNPSDFARYYNVAFDLDTNLPNAARRGDLNTDEDDD